MVSAVPSVAQTPGSPACVSGLCRRRLYILRADGDAWKYEFSNVYDCRKYEKYAPNLIKMN